MAKNHNRLAGELADYEDQCIADMGKAAFMIRRLDIRHAFYAGAATALGSLGTVLLAAEPLRKEMMDEIEYAMDNEFPLKNEPQPGLN